jgi:membrane carboxypeptidase/penicillin-binding protein
MHHFFGCFEWSLFYVLAKFIKFCFILGLLALIGYVSVVSIWAWQALFPLADVAMQSPYEPLSKWQKQTLLAVEDPNFYNHIGVDFSLGQGTETVSSRVADSVYFEGPLLEGNLGKVQNFFWRVNVCCKRFDLGRYVMALVVDWRLTKEEQLQIFVSNVPMGRFKSKAVYGLPSAALVYFERDIASLSEEQWVKLIAIVLSPRSYDPINDSQQWLERSGRVMRMLKGECSAKNWQDDEYKDCSEDSQNELQESGGDGVNETYLDSDEIIEFIDE